MYNAYSNRIFQAIFDALVAHGLSVEDIRHNHNILIWIIQSEAFIVELDEDNHRSVLIYHNLGDAR